MRRYAVAHADALIEPLGGDVLVFDPLSWETHVLNTAAATVLQAIAECPRTQAELAALLAELLVDEERGSALMHACATVGQLESLGLVVATESP